ncbi:MAG: hypothetical protein WCA07_02545 [Gloeobacterales cyanobacterium]
MAISSWSQVRSQVTVNTNADGSVFVDTGRVQVQTGGVRPSVRIDGEEQNTESSSSSVSTSHTRVSITRGDLAMNNYLVMIQGPVGQGSIQVNNQTVVRFTRPEAKVLLNSYLRSGLNSVIIQGTGSSNLMTALVQAKPGNTPYFRQDGQLEGTSRVLIRQNQNQSGSGSWRSVIEVQLE